MYVDKDEIICSDYQRHNTKQPEKSLEILKRSMGISDIPLKNIL